MWENSGSYTNNSTEEQIPVRGSQNAWENSYTDRYRQTAQPGADPAGSYRYTSAAFTDSYPVPPATPRKKTGLGVKIGIAVAAVALLALFALGGYEVAQLTQAAQHAAQSENAGGSGNTSGESGAKLEKNDIAGSKEAGNGSSQRITTISSSSPVVVTDVTQVVASSMPSIVAIDNSFTQTVNFYGQNYTQQDVGSGSGIIVGRSDDALLIATNYHVIEGADSLQVQFVDETRADATVRDGDPDRDLAVIAVSLKDVSDETLNSIVIATLGNSDSLVLGEPVIAIGNALGQGQSVTTGVVSALNRQIELSDGSTGTFIQTDAAINPGNSGGALLNSAGEVIGINSNKFAMTDVEGMGYAIPISEAQPIIDEMMNREVIPDDERGYLGISGATVPYEYTGIEGVRVRGVFENSGAENAGITEDDIIIRIEGETVKGMESLQNKLRYHRAGDVVTLTVLRRSNDRYVEVDIDVTLSDAETCGIDPSATQKQDNSRQEEERQNSQESPYGGGYSPYEYVFPYFWEGGY